MITPSTERAFYWQDLGAVVLLALIGRALLIATGSISFHSDEGIVALMASHMLDGRFPVFFYGQAYMGSFNALSTAAGFAVLGETVLAIRIVQLIKFGLFVGTGYWAAWHLSHNRVVALVTALTLAVSHTMGATYTATNIGGYVETLTFGNLMLILGYDVARTHPYSLWRWVLLGLIAGLAWWTNGLIIAFALPIALLCLWTLLRRADQRGRYIGLIGVALVCFFIGGAPWWLYDFTHDNAALAVYIPAVSDAPTGGIEPIEASFSQKVIGLALFAVPTVVGMRHTWATSYFLPLVGLPVLLIYIAALYQLARASRPPLREGARWLVFGVPGLLLVVFLATSFGADPTGRYFLPLLLPFGIALGAFTAHLRQTVQARYVWVLPAALILAYNTAGQGSAALQNDPGLTTQFDLLTHIPHTHDAELIAFLQANDITHGYASYWVAIRTAFLSGEAIQYSSALPYKPQLTYNPADNRYPPYQQAAENAERIAYINVTLLPELDAVLQEQFAAAGITYDVATIGPYVVYYNFDPAAPRLRFEGESVTLDDSRR